MITVCSVGYGKDSPPKNTSFYHSAIGAVSDNAAIVAPQMNVIANFETVQTYYVSAYANARIPEITAKAIYLPAPKVVQMNKYIHLYSVTNHLATILKPRCRSSDYVKAINSKRSSGLSPDERS